MLRDATWSILALARFVLQTTAWLSGYLQNTVGGLQNPRIFQMNGNITIKYLAGDTWIPRGSYLRLVTLLGNSFGGRESIEWEADD